MKPEDVVCLALLDVEIKVRSRQVMPLLTVMASRLVRLGLVDDNKFRDMVMVQSCRDGPCHQGNQSSALNLQRPPPVPLVHAATAERELPAVVRAARSRIEKES